MTRDEVLALAREVGLWEMLEGYSSEYGSLDAEEDCLPNLQRFAALVAAHEREECAKTCEQLELRSADGQFGTYVAGWSDGTDDCATAIRSRT